jgi:hypothetical protein
MAGFLSVLAAAMTRTGANGKRKWLSLNPWWLPWLSVENFIDYAALR